MRELARHQRQENPQFELIDQQGGTKALSVLTGILVALLATGAFALSFDSLNKLAVENGIKVGLSWVWPLVLDGAIVVFSLSALRSRLHGESVRYPMSLVVITTGASVAFNIAHAPIGLLAHTMAAVPPLALFLSFELLMRQLHTSVQRTAILSTKDELEQELQILSKERKKLSKDIEIKQEKSMEASRTNMKLLSSRKSNQKQSKKDKILQRQETVSALLASKLSAGQIADRIGVSQKTIQRDIRAISG